MDADDGRAPEGNSRARPIWLEPDVLWPFLWAIVGATFVAWVLTEGWLRWTLVALVVLAIVGFLVWVDRGTGPSSSAARRLEAQEAAIKALSLAEAKLAADRMLADDDRWEIRVAEGPFDSAVGADLGPETRAFFDRFVQVQHRYGAIRLDRADIGASERMAGAIRIASGVIDDDDEPGMCEWAVRRGDDRVTEMYGEIELGQWPSLYHCLLRGEVPGRPADPRRSPADGK